MFSSSDHNYSGNISILHSDYILTSNYCKLFYADNLNVSTVRDPKRAEYFLLKSCDLNHAASCFNLAVMYKNGDVGVSADPKKFEAFKEKTLELRKTYGGLSGTRKG